MTSRMEDQSGIIRIIIAGSFLLSRQTLCRRLEQDPNIQIVGEAENVYRFRNIIESLQPVDVLLIDDQLIHIERIKLLTEIQARCPGTKVLIADDLFSEDHIAEALLHGVRGFILKSAQDHVYVRAIHAIHKGDIWAERKVLAHALEHLIQSRSNLPQPCRESWEDLTPREQEIILLITRGMTNKEIAKELGISDSTIKTHLSRIFAKLKLSRRIQLALQARSTKPTD